jgi:hypothetical protein
LKKPEVLESTPFSRFFRSASEEEKRRVYKQVIERSIKAQLDVIECAKAMPPKQN